MLSSHCKTKEQYPTFAPNCGKVMKSHFIYIVLFLLILLSGWSSQKTPAVNCDSVDASTEQTYISKQVTPLSANHDISRNYRESFNSFCDYVNISSLPIPTIKYILRFNLFQLFCSEDSRRQKYHTHSSPLLSFTPTEYYVFGLRKIII